MTGKTIEDKYKFIVLYWGQTILKVQPDYEAKLIGKNFQCYYDEQMMYLELLSHPMINVNDKTLNPSFNIDQLRKEGYACPWNRITIQEQIDLGWVRLKSNQEI